MATRYHNKTQINKTSHQQIVSVSYELTKLIYTVNN